MIPFPGVSNAPLDLASGVETWLGTPSSANLRTALTDETGTGLAYFQGGDIGTPSAGVLTNCTGLPLSGLGAMARVSGSTYSTVQHLQDIFHSSGHSSGGTITDAGGGNVDVAAGTGFIRATDSEVAEVKFFDWSSSAGNAIPSNTTRYIGVEWNAGTPQVVVKTTYDWDFNTDFPLGNVVNDAGTLHIENAPHKVGDHANKMIQRAYQTMPLQRDDRTGGLILGESGTRNVTMSAGALWERIERFAIASIDTSVASTFDRYYRDGVGGWTEELAETQWPNTQYDDDSGTLVTMTNNRYANLWFYIELDGGLIALYPQAQYANEADAEAETPPSSTPDRISVQGKLIGRLIFKKSAATATAIESVFGVTFQGAIVTDHANLSDLAWTSSGHSGTATRIAAFDGTGAAAEYTMSGTGTEVALTTSPTFVTPALGTPASGVGTNLTGTAAGLTAGNATTAAVATTVTVADESTDTTCFPLFATAATGDLAPKSNASLAFDSANGYLGVGVAPTFGFDLVATAASQFLIGSSTADATTKTARFAARHYTAAEEPIMFFEAKSKSGNTVCKFGGGSNAFNAVTEIRFFTAATVTTLEGTQRLTIDAGGDVTVNAGDLVVNAGAIKITEQAAAGADTAGKGQLWVKNTTPCQLWFTDDAGTDTQIV